MLWIITGTPGAGKTQWFISLLFGILAKKNRKVVIGGEEVDRLVFENGINGIDHEALDILPLADGALWYECPIGSVIALDECQRIFPQRMAGKEVPRTCREFETHRHTGKDIFLITQDATLVDAHVRKLVNYHVHIDRLYGLPIAKVYTYPRFIDKPNDEWNKKKVASSRKWFFYRKKYYRAYKSSEVHTVKKKVPWAFFLLPAIIGFVWYNGSNLMDRFEGEAVDEAEAVNPAFAGPSIANLPTADRKANARTAYMESITPVIDGYPWTAPQYLELMEKPKSFPRPYCIIEELGTQEENCICHSQQATTLYLDKAACKNIALNGWFNPMLADSEEGGERGRERQPATLPPDNSPVNKSGVRGINPPGIDISVLPAANRVEGRQNRVY